MPVRKSHNYHKPSPFREVARRMQHGDSVVVASRDLFRLATQINMSGASYTYKRMTEGVRVWKVQNAQAVPNGERDAPQKR